MRVEIVAVSRRSLSDVELAVLRALAEGSHSKEIALQLGRSKPTVEGYVRQLCVKFEARSRAQLVAKALAEGALQHRLALEPHANVSLHLREGRAEATG